MRDTLQKIPTNHTESSQVIPAGLKAECECFVQLRLVCHAHTQLLTHISRDRCVEGIVTGQRCLEHADHAAVFGVNCLRE